MIWRTAKSTDVSRPQMPSAILDGIPRTGCVAGRRAAMVAMMRSYADAEACAAPGAAA